MRFYNVRLQLGDLPLLLAALADDDALSQQLFGIAEAARAKWARLAQRNLGTTRQAYLLGLSQPFFDGPNQVTVELDGELPNKIEQGADPFSLLEGLLSAPGALRTKDGARYRPVPIRMTAPGTSGRAGQPMDVVYAPPGPDSRSTRRGREDAAEIGRTVFAQAKTLRKGRSLPQFADLPLLKPEHAIDPFSGLTRGGQKGHRYYVAFRTASDRVDGKWQHPGFQARHFAKAAAEHAQKVGPAALRRLAKSLSKPVEAPPGPEV